MNRTRPACNIFQSADKIDDAAILPRIKRVDGEIAPLRIDLPVTAKHHLGSPAIGLGIVPERGNLETAAIDDQRHRAVIDPGRHRADARLFSPRDHLLGRPACRQVGIGDRQSHQRIADRTADHTDLFSILVQKREDPAKRFLPEPVLMGNARVCAHA
jgi:hypothetical protein